MGQPNSIDARNPSSTPRQGGVPTTIAHSPATQRQTHSNFFFSKSKERPPCTGAGRGEGSAAPSPAARRRKSRRRATSQPTVQSRRRWPRTAGGGNKDKTDTNNPQQSPVSRTGRLQAENHTPPLPFKKTQEGKEHAQRQRPGRAQRRTLRWWLAM